MGKHSRQEEEEVRKTKAKQQQEVVEEEEEDSEDDDDVNEFDVDDLPEDIVPFEFKAGQEFYAIITEINPAEEAITDAQIEALKHSLNGLVHFELYTKKWVEGEVFDAASGDDIAALDVDFPSQKFKIPQHLKSDTEKFVLLTAVNAEKADPETTFEASENGIEIDGFRFQISEIGKEENEMVKEKIERFLEAMDGGEEFDFEEEEGDSDEEDEEGDEADE